MKKKLMIVRAASIFAAMLALSACDKQNNTDSTPQKPADAATAAKAATEAKPVVSDKSAAPAAIAQADKAVADTVSAAPAPAQIGQVREIYNNLEKSLTDMAGSVDVNKLTSRLEVAQQAVNSLDTLKTSIKPTEVAQQVQKLQDFSQKYVTLATDLKDAAVQTATLTKELNTLSPTNLQTLPRYTELGTKIKDLSVRLNDERKLTAEKLTELRQIGDKLKTYWSK